MEESIKKEQCFTWFSQALPRFYQNLQIEPITSAARKKCISTVAH